MIVWHPRGRANIPTLDDNPNWSAGSAPNRQPLLCPEKPCATQYRIALSLLQIHKSYHSGTLARILEDAALPAASPH